MPRILRTARCGIILTLAVALCTAAAWAQFSSNLQGTIQDPSGAAIPNAKVTLENTANHVSSSTASGADGIYRFVSLAPGDYKLSVEVAQFAIKAVNVTLQTGQTLNVPVTMSVEAKETVTVEAETPLVNTSESRTELTLETQALSALPLAGRSMIGLVTLAPGASGLGLSSGSPGSASDNYSTETQVDASANGRGSVNNLFIVDGLDVTSIIRPGVLNLTPNPDSVQESTTEVNTFSVEYARGASLINKMTTKSGTDKFHGLISDYYTDQHLWTGTEFVHSYAPFHSNNMSAAIGGPIVPHHQAFFFFSIEPLRASASTGTGTYTFEDPAFTAFAKQNFPNSLGTSILAKYPASSASGVAVSKTAAKVFPGTCGTSATANIPCTLPMIDTGVFNATNFRNGTQYNVRGDKYFKNDRIYANFYRTLLDTGGPAIRPGFTSSSHFTQYAIQANETHTFSSNTLLEGSFSFMRIEGILPQTGTFTVPVVNVVGQNSIGNGFALGDFTQRNYHWRAVVTHVQGSHAFKVGYDGLRPQDIADFTGPYSQPTFNFNTLLDLVQDNPHEETGISYDPLTGQKKPWLWNTAEVVHGVFFEDTWKARKHLTLTYGLRWDDFGNPYGIGKVQVPNFHLGPGQTRQEQIANGFMLSTGHILNHSLTDILSPRFGVAWDPTGQGTYVVRGGFGVYHQWPTLGNLDNALVNNPPNFIFPDFLNGTTTAPVFSLGTSNKPPFGYTYPSLGNTQLDPHGGLAGLQISVGAVDPALKAPNTYTYSATVERKLAKDLVASVGYAGSKSTGLMTGSGQTTATSYGFDINRFAGDLIQNRGVLTRLNPSFGSIRYSENGAEATYNALIVSLRGRFSRRGFLTASYTRSVSKDDTQVYPTTDIHQYHGPSVWDVPNRLSLAWSYELPGASNGRGLVGHITNGWILSATTILQSGYPFTVFTNAPFSGGGDYNADGFNYDYPNVSSYNVPTGRQNYLQGLFNPSNFTAPTPGTEGNEKFNGFRGPGFAETDINFAKETALTERLHLQLRFEFYNIFNRPNLNNVDANLPSGTFGRATGQYNPRWIQVGAKLQF